MEPSFTTAIVTKPVLEPISLAELKEFLRERSTDYDGELRAMITEAREYIEQHTGRALITQTWNLILDWLPLKIKLPYPPLQTVVSVSYQDLDNTTQTLASSNYTVDTSSTPGRLYQSYGGTYPATYPDLNAVTIQFTCGFGTQEDVPDMYKRAIKLYCQWQNDQDLIAFKELKRIMYQGRVNWFVPDS